MYRPAVVTCVFLILFLLAYFAEIKSPVSGIDTSNLAKRHSRISKADSARVRNKLPTAALRSQVTPGTLSSSVQLSRNASRGVQVPSAAHSDSLPRPQGSVSQTGEVGVTSALKLPRRDWAAVETAAACWSSNGTWEERRAGGYEWVPARHCPPWEPLRPRKDSAGGCVLAERLLALLRPRKHAAAPIVFVGDSVTMQYHRVFSTEELNMMPLHRRNMAIDPGTSVAVPPPDRLASTVSAPGESSSLAGSEDEDDGGGGSQSASCDCACQESSGVVLPSCASQRSNGIGGKRGRRLAALSHAFYAIRGCSTATAEFFRNDMLLRDGKNCSDPGPPEEYPAGCPEHGTFTPWEGALTPETLLVILNRGAHYEPDGSFLRGWKAALQIARQRAPNALIVARTTPPGISNCNHYRKPVAQPPAPVAYYNTAYHWHDFPRQNDLLRKLVADSFPGVLLLDVVPLSMLRPDARRGGGDCLHFGSRSGPRRVLEVAATAPTSILVNAVSQLQRAVGLNHGQAQQPLRIAKGTPTARKRS